MLEIGNPALDWVALAKAQGVEAARVRNLDEFDAELGRSLGSPGPKLI